MRDPQPASITQAETEKWRMQEAQVGFHTSITGDREDRLTSLKTYTDYLRFHVFLTVNKPCETPHHVSALLLDAEFIAKSMK